jgi:hypothetical protein
MVPADRGWIAMNGAVEPEIGPLALGLSESENVNKVSPTGANFLLWPTSPQ